MKIYKQYVMKTYCPRIIRSGAVLRLSICPFVRLYVRKNFYIGHIFCLVRLGVFIFHMSIPCDNTFLLVPSSRSPVKVTVKYEGRCGISVSQTQLVYCYCSLDPPFMTMSPLFLSLPNE